ASPCGEVIARDEVLLLNEGERVFPALRDARPKIYESLLAPFYIDGEPAGTVWALKHSKEGRFEREDARILQSLAHFASMAHQMVQTVRALESAREAGRRNEELRRIALEGGRMGAWRWDCRTRLGWGDAECLALWGVPLAIGSHPISVFTSRMAPESATAVEAVMAKEIAPGEEFDAQVEIAAGPAAGRWLRWRGRAERERPWVIDGVSFDVTEQRLAEQRLRESEERQAFLLTLSDALRPLGDPVEVQDVAARLVGEHLGSDRACYIEIEPAQDLAVITREYLRGEAVSLRGRHPISAFRFGVDQSREGRPVVWTDIPRDPRLPDSERPSYAALSIVSAVNVPLIKDGELVAILTVTNAQPRDWMPGEIALLEDVAERTWAAMQRASAEAKLRERAAWLAAQKEAFQAAVNGAPLRDSLGVLIRTALAQGDGNLHCAFYMADESGTALRHVTGMPEPYALCVDGFRIG
ncbi:MAG: GAF domain-containing protein, partial [Solirubrobacterales bacterium]|nr:GAF domain-containing protein [Solirubrobacterales bacterium]